MTDPAIFAGPRALKEKGSPDWCWQTIDLLKQYLLNIEQTWRQADEVVAELRDVRAEKVLGPPYGSFNKLCLDLLGMSESEVSRKIDREKIKALGSNGGDRRSGAFQSSATGLKPDRETAGHIVAKLKRDDPTLADAVVRGEISPNAAAMAKGWRKPRVLVTTPESVAGQLREHMTREDQLTLATLLLADSSPRTGRLLQPCGTPAAYQRHRKRNEKACEPCLQAMRDKSKADYDAKKAPR